MKQKLKQAILRAPAKRWTCTLIAFFAALLVGWYAGFDMLQRGVDQAFFLVAAFALATIVWTCPIWPKEKQNTITPTQEAK